MWRRDPKIEADAITLDDFDWYEKHGIRPRADTFYRNERGELEQEQIVIRQTRPSWSSCSHRLRRTFTGSAARSSIHHTGSVWIDGSNPAQGALPASGSGSDFLS